MSEETGRDTGFSDPRQQEHDRVRPHAITSGMVAWFDRDVKGNFCAHVDLRTFFAVLLIFLEHVSGAWSVFFARDLWWCVRLDGDDFHNLTIELGRFIIEN